MVNSKLFNIHDVLMIGLIAILLHVFLGPLYDRIGTTSQSSTDTQ